jgi:hypothetical protein
MMWKKKNPAGVFVSIAMRGAPEVNRTGIQSINDIHPFFHPLTLRPSRLRVFARTRVSLGLGQASRLKASERM